MSIIVKRIHMMENRMEQHSATERRPVYVHFSISRTFYDRYANLLAAVGTATAMLACYGITVIISMLSLIGISVALPFRAPVIILFSGIAAASLTGSYRRHHSRLVVALGLVGFVLITGSKVLPPDLKAGAIAIEGAGFLCMAIGNLLVLRARRREHLSCIIQSTV